MPGVTLRQLRPRHPPSQWREAPGRRDGISAVLVSGTKGTLANFVSVGDDGNLQVGNGIQNTEDERLG